LSTSQTVAHGKISIQRTWQLVEAIIQKLEGDQYCPSKETVHFLCVLNNVCRGGNNSAHMASQGEIKKVIETVGIGEPDLE
jgi:hypothetical protein